MSQQSQPVDPYHLDLDDEELFPSFDDLPNEYSGDVSERVVQGGMWYFVCEIVGNESMLRPMYRVRDTAGATALVAFYLDNGNAEATRLKQFKSGTTLILEQPWAKMFMDGQHGIRLEDSDVAGVTNLPCSLAELRAAHKYLASDAKEFKGCAEAKPAKRCSRCAVPYCDVECQRGSWSKHKAECKVITHLRGMNALAASYAPEFDDPNYDDYDDYEEYGSASDSDGASE